MSELDAKADAALRTPPWAGVREVVSRLEREGLPCALGGSGLLVALGLATEAHDWDLTTDAPLERVDLALADLDPQRFGSDGLHGDHKLVVLGGVVEVIVGFAFIQPGGLVRLPTRITRRWQDLPVGSPEVWAVAYALLDRPAKAATLFGWLATHGADPATRDALLREPLPDAVRERLAALPSISP